MKISDSVAQPQYPLVVLGLSDTRRRKECHVVMSCYHPLRGIVLSRNAETGKKRIRIVSSDFKSPENESVEYIQIPCGHCIGCFLDRSRQWADRCMCELQYHDKAAFITLTYDDKNLPPKQDYYDEQTGECFSGFINPLVKKDLQLFMKRLRKRLEPQKVRFFACGEYGETTHRPHYHIILFGEDFAYDRKFYKNNAQGQPLYNSPTLSDLWPYGFSVTADVTWDTCAYVARYVTKKIQGDDNQYYEKYNLPREFTVMSRKPGIGRQYFDDHKDKLYDQDFFYYSTQDGAKQAKPSKYYDRLYESEFPDDYKIVRDRKVESSKTKTKLKMDLTSLDYLSILSLEEQQKEAVTKILKRKEI